MRRVLLLTSYCGCDNEHCNDAKPCVDCLQMCNVALMSGDVEVLGEFGSPATLMPLSIGEAIQDAQAQGAEDDALRGKP